MESIDKAARTILDELISDDNEIRRAYLSQFGVEAKEFAAALASALDGWESLDNGTAEDTDRAYIAAMGMSSITLQILSMKLLLCGHQVASGGLFRQAVEACALLLLCSQRALGFLERVKADKYSVNDAVRDALRNAKTLGVALESLEALKEAQKLYHQYSHPGLRVIGAGVSIESKQIFLGVAFDDEKIDVYRTEVHTRIELAAASSQYLAVVLSNVSAW